MLWIRTIKSLFFLPDLLFQRKLQELSEVPTHKASTHKFLQHQFPEKKHHTNYKSLELYVLHFAASAFNYYEADDNTGTMSNKQVVHA